MFKIPTSWLKKDNARRMVVYENTSIFTLGIILFALNQLIEILLINFFDANYSSLCKWDCGWYSGIVSRGYDIAPHAHAKLDAANWAFFPFVPLVATSLATIANISAPMSLVLTSKALFLLAIYAFMKMAKEYSSDIPYVVSGSVVAFSPYAIYGNVGYTESAFLLFSAWFFYCLKRQQFISAALVGAFLTSVRLVCVFSVLSYFINGLSKLRNKQMDLNVLILGSLLIPLGLAFFMFYLYWLTGDALAFVNIQRAWGRIPSNPINFIVDGLQGDLLNKYWAVLSVAAILASSFLAYKKMYEFAIFSFLCTIIPLSTGLWGMPRYVFWQSPILFLIAYLLSKRRMWFLFLPFFTAGQVIMYIGWFSGKGWVI